MKQLNKQSHKRVVRLMKSATIVLSLSKYVRCLLARPRVVDKHTHVPTVLPIGQIRLINTWTKYRFDQHGN